MKRILIGLILLIACFTLNAQRGQTQVLVADTLKGNNNKTLATIPVTGTYESLFISVKVDRISTAAGGTLYLKSGIDAASSLVVNQSTNPSVEFAANDTLATTDVATQYWNISITEPAAKYYYIFGDGDANDTVKVTTTLILK